jgi:hypothetical protein
MPIFSATVLASAVTAGASLYNSQQNRDFQQRNSDTSYQRAVKDLKAAGLNPILAAKNGGASTPTGAMATIPDFGATLNSAFANSNNRMKIDAEVEEIAAQTELNEAQTNLLKEQLPEVRARIERIQAETGYRKAMTQIPELVGDLIQAIRELGKINSVAEIKAAISDLLTIDIQERAPENSTGWSIEWNRERQLR